MKQWRGKVFYANEDHMNLPEYVCEADTEEEAEKIFIEIANKKYSKKYFEFCEVYPLVAES